jgi:hypothetical protein
MKSHNFVQASELFMLRIEKMIMIGATARQSGKTEMASRIISKFCNEIKITGIKVTTVQKGDVSYHGSLELPSDKNFIIEKSSFSHKNKSTDRLLAAGAAETFWLHSRFGFLEEAWEKLSSMIDKESFLVCESNSLRKILQPDIFILIRNLKKEIKGSVIDLIEKADQIIDFSDNVFMKFDLNRIAIINGKWIMNKSA